MPCIWVASPGDCGGGGAASDLAPHLRGHRRGRLPPRRQRHGQEPPGAREPGDGPVGMGQGGVVMVR